MNKKNVALLMEKMFQEEVAVRDVAQKEYAHDDEEACANFIRLGAELKLDPKKVLWIYFKKHLDGILAHINGFKSQREDVRGRIKDARVYLVLLRALIEDEERLGPQTAAVPHAYATFVERELAKDMEREMGRDRP